MLILSFYLYFSDVIMLFLLTIKNKRTNKIKPTNTGLLLNFNANCPQTWKSSLIMCLLHRAKKICSNDFLYKQEVKKLCSLFQKNYYPISFINKVIEKFNGNSKPEKYEKHFLFTIGLPYNGKTSNQLAKRLANLIKLKFNIY